MKKSLVMSLFLSVMFCVSSFAADDVILAKIGDKKLTMADLDRIIGYYDAEKQKTLQENPQFKATIVLRIVQGMVISGIARDKGFDKRADIKEQLDLLVNDFLTTEYLKKEVVDKIHVTEDDAKLYYKAHQEEFRTPEMARFRQILIRVDKSASVDEKKKAKEKIEGILKRVKAGEDFAKLASEFSEDPSSRPNGGDMGFLTKGRMVPEFEKDAFPLKPGEVSDVFETAVGFHIVKCEEKKESVLEPYDKITDKVKEKVFADFRQAKVSEFVQKAMKDAGVELNLEPFLPKH